MHDRHCNNSECHWLGLRPAANRYKDTGGRWLAMHSLPRCSRAVHQQQTKKSPPTGESHGPPASRRRRVSDHRRRCREDKLRGSRAWLAVPAFAAYRTQIDWLIDEKKWAGLLDRFYQIMPFGTGGPAGAVGVGPNRMNLWTLASSAGALRVSEQALPSMPKLAVALAYDVRQFEDQRQNYNPTLPNPVLHLRPGVSRNMPPASTRRMASMPIFCPTPAADTWRRRSCRSRFGFCRHRAA